LVPNLITPAAVCLSAAQFGAVLEAPTTLRLNDVDDGTLATWRRCVPSSPKDAGGPREGDLACEVGS